LDIGRMRDLLTSNDPVLLNYAQVLLEDAGIGVVVFDGNMSSVQGTLSAVQQRLAVPEDNWVNARRILDEAGLGQWIVR
jgi:Putative prokaryotic signal transducing protein